MLRINSKKGKDFSLFISINASEEPLNDEIIYYYPNQKFEMDELTFFPETPNKFLDFYRKNLKKYSDLIKSVKMLVAVKVSLNAFNVSIGNSVKIKKDQIEKKCLLTCMSLMQLPDVNSDEDIFKVEFFMINAHGSETVSKNLSSFFKKMDFVVNLENIQEKLILFEKIKDEFDLLKVDLVPNVMDNHSEFLNCVKRNECEFLFKEPITQKIVSPTLDILLLSTENIKESFNMENTIEIDLNLYENFNRNESEIKDITEEPESTIIKNNSTNENENDFVTYITHHIPRQSSEIFFGKSKKIKSLFKEADEKDLASYIKKTDKIISYENLRNLEFSKNCTIYYDKSINFGKVLTEEIPFGLRRGYFSFNKNSAGTIILDSSLNPLGISCFGSFDFYPLKVKTPPYNIFIPFSHIGVLYMLRKFLSQTEEINLDQIMKNMSKVYKEKDCEKINKKEELKDQVETNNENNNNVMTEEKLPEQVQDLPEEKLTKSSEDKKYIFISKKHMRK